jgi:hypothetical protein
VAVVMAVVTARSGTLRVVVRPLLFVLAAVIVAVIALSLFCRSCWLVVVRVSRGVALSRLHEPS